MKLRFAVPAALAVAGALALPSGASADPAQCPDHFTPTFIFIQPDAAGKDKNGNLVVCHKDTPGNGDPTKDDHGFITQTINDPNPDDWADDIL